MRFDGMGDLFSWQHKISCCSFARSPCNPRSVGAIAPSGANLASLITSEITAASGPVLELGPGTGVFTEALLERGVRESDLTLIEYGSDFMRLLQARFPEGARALDGCGLDGFPRSVRAAAGRRGQRAAAAQFSRRESRAILTAAFSKLRDGGAFYQFTYGMQCPVSRALLDELGLKANCMGRVLLNVPPASVYRITRIKPARLADQVEPDAV